MSLPTPSPARPRRTTNTVGSCGHRYPDELGRMIESSAICYRPDPPMLPARKKVNDGSRALYQKKDSPGVEGEPIWLPAPDAPSPRLARRRVFQKYLDQSVCRIGICLDEIEAKSANLRFECLHKASCLALEWCMLVVKGRTQSTRLINHGKIFHGIGRRNEGCKSCPSHDNMNRLGESSCRSHSSKRLLNLARF